MDWASSFSFNTFKEKLHILFDGIRVLLEDNRIKIDLPCGQLLECLIELKEKYLFYKLIDVVAMETPDESEPLLDILFILERPDDSKIIFLKTTYKSSDNILDFSSLWKSSNWYIREIMEFFGGKCNIQNIPRLITHDGINGYPLLKNFSGKAKKSPIHRRYFSISTSRLPTVNSTKQWFNLGPFHPLTSGKFRILAEIEGDIINKSEIEIGYWHVGLEKMFEQHNCTAVIPFFKRFSSNHNDEMTLLWLMSIEDLLKINIPDRVKAIRMIYLEFYRIREHIDTIFNLINGIDNDFASSEIIKIMNWFKKFLVSLYPQNLKGSVHCLGGLKEDIRRESVVYILQNINKIQMKLYKLDQYLIKSMQWMTKLDTKIIKAKTALEYGLEGPNLRASGIRFDLRKNDPYYFYNEIDFVIPLGAKGNSYDRYMVRIMEVQESIKIINQLLDNIPCGEIQTDSSRFNMINEIILPRSMNYTRIESARGELGIFIRGNDNSFPYRVKLMGPSFKLLNSLDGIIEEENIDNFFTVINSLDINILEVDR